MDRKIPNLDAEEYEDANDDLYKPQVIVEDVD